MQIKMGNAKLGPRIGTISRPVGATCPGDCPLLGKGCYADRLQRFRPGVLGAWNKNVEADWKAWSLQVADDLSKVTALRINVAGDVLLDGRLDRGFVAALLRAFRHHVALGGSTPGWLYTHAWRELAPHVPFLRKVGVQCFASLHGRNHAEWEEAKGYGYRIAMASVRTKKSWVPGTNIGLWENQMMVCPEQAGTRKSCQDCGWCFRPKDYGVVFLKH